MTSIARLAQGDRPPVYIESQVTSRDLHARLLLGARLAALGHPVLVGRGHAVLSAAKVNPPGIFLSDWGFTHGAIHRLREMRQFGHITYSQCEESTAYVAPDLYKKIRLLPDALNTSEAVFCTNGQQLELIDEVLGARNAPPRHNTGNIRFELLGHFYRDVYTEQARALVKKHGDFVLVTTNGKLRNVRDVDKTVLHLHQSLGLNLEDARKFGTLIEDRAEAQKAFMHDVLAVAAANPRLRFVLRAKYNEIRPIRELYAHELPANVKIETEGGIQPWVLSARALVMNNCTTGMDAFAADTPSLFYYPEGLNVEPLEGPAALSTSLQGQQSLAQALMDPPSNAVLPPSLVDRFMPSINRASHKEIALKISETPIHSLSKWNPPFRASLGFPRFYLPISQRRELWWKAILHRLSPSRSLGGRIRSSDVFGFLSQLRMVDDSLSAVRCRQIDFELYGLSVSKKRVG